MARRQRDYAAEYAARQRRAREAGYPGGYPEQRAERRRAEEILGHRPWERSGLLRRGPKGEAELIRAWTEGKLMGIARRQGNKTGEAQHRRNMDFALLDLQVIRRDFVIEEDFFYH